MKYAIIVSNKFVIIRLLMSLVLMALHPGEGGRGRGYSKYILYGGGGGAPPSPIPFDMPF